MRLPPATHALLRAVAAVRRSSRARVLATALRLYERHFRQTGDRVAPPSARRRSRKR